MSWWSKLIGGAKPPAASPPAPSAAPSAPPAPGPATPSPAAAAVLLGDQPTAKIVRELQRSRYAHMGKLYEMLEQYGDAERTYNLLAEATAQTVGADHPDFAAALHELGRLNQRHLVEHAPELQQIYDTLGSSNQIFAFYDNARQVREAALGPAHPAHAQSLWALATWHRDARDRQHVDAAKALLDQALAVQRSEADPLPTALSLACQGDVDEIAEDAAAAVEHYREALTQVAMPSAALQALDTAEQLCRNAGNQGDAANRIRQARVLQGGLADPYFDMCFRLIEASAVEVLPMVLDLHRQQYRREYLGLRAHLLTVLADGLAKAGDDGAAAKLRNEAALADDWLARLTKPPPNGAPPV